MVEGIAGAGTLVIGGSLTVTRLGFGAMRVTGRGIWGDPPDRGASIALLRRAVDLGVNFIDTADSYGPAVSESLIAEALHPYPRGLVIATKGGFTRPGPSRWVANGRPDHLRKACEGSLARLRLPAIDLYQLHTVDSRVPFEESVGALAELRAQGKIRHVGLSNVTTAQLARARTIVPVVSVQNRYNLGDRAAEDVLEACARDGLAFIPWYPLGAGDLTRRARRLEAIAVRHQATPSQIALTWLLRRSPVMVPIPGTGSVAHLEENLGAARIQLGEDEFKTLEEMNT